MVLMLKKITSRLIRLVAASFTALGLLYSRPFDPWPKFMVIVRVIKMYIFFKHLIERLNKIILPGLHILIWVVATTLNLYGFFIVVHLILGPTPWLWYDTIQMFKIFLHLMVRHNPIVYIFWTSNGTTQSKCIYF